MRSSLTRGSAIVASFALVAAGLAATPAAADDGTVTKIGPGQIAPVENDETYNTWHQGNSAATSGTYSFTADGLRLRGKNQIMTGDETLATESITDLIASFEVTADGADAGELWYQFPLYYGGNSKFTTLRKDVLDAGDLWTTSTAIVVGDDTRVAANASAPLEDLVAAITDDGGRDARPLGYGVYTDPGSDVVVKAVEIDGRKTTFGAQAETSTDQVTVGDIKPAPETADNYNDWHQGHWKPSEIGTHSFTADGLKLSGGVNQILKGDKDRFAQISVDTLIDSIKVDSDAQEGELFHQVPLYYGPETNPDNSPQFTTLRKDVTDESDNDLWISSRAIVTKGSGTVLAANTPTPLATVVAALESASATYASADYTPSVDVIGYGVYSSKGSVVVKSVTVWGQQTTFGAEAGASTDHVSVGGIKPAPETAENYDSWHQGNWDPAKTGTHSFTADGLKLSGGVNQILKGELESKRFAEISVEAIIGSITVDSDAATGELYHQVPLYYGPETDANNSPQFTTLRKDVRDNGNDWTSSRAIVTKSDTTVLAANTPTPLATVVAALEYASATYASADYAPSVDVIGYGVYSNKGSVVVKSVTVWGETTTFGAAVPEASTVSVAHGDIASSETEENYTTWHQGHWNPEQVGTIALSPEGATLSGGINQLLKGDAERFAELSVEAIIGSIKVDSDAQEGELFHQVPLYYGPETNPDNSPQFTTLRKDVTESDNDLWISSRAIVTKGSGTVLAANTPTPLATVVAAIESASATYASDTYAPSVDVIGYGVYSDASATVVVSDLTVWGVTYDFRQGAAAAAAVTISGKARVGETLTADAAEVKGSEPTFAWSKDGGPIEGATSAALELTPELLGAEITVTATYPAGIYKETVVSSDSVTIAEGVLPEVAVAINGDARVGESISAVATPVDGADVTYAWFAGDDVIADATGETLALTPALVGKHIKVTVTYARTGYTTAKATSQAVKVAKGTHPEVVVTLSGDARVGGTLKAQATAVEGSSIVYEWTADGEIIDDATGTSLTLAPALVGKEVAVSAIYTNPAYQTAATASDARVIGKGVHPAVSVTVSGDEVVGGTLVSDATAVKGSTVSYAWFADGVAIAGATGDSLVLVPALVGADITVSATYTNAAYVSVTVVSDAVEVGKGVHPAVSVTVSGDEVVGGTLVSDATAVEGSDIAYAWFADGVAIAGATGDSLVLVPALVGADITVSATYTNAAYVSVTVVSDAVEVGKGVHPAVAVTVSGDAVVGATLKATASEVEGSTVSYAWLADGEAIAEATGASLTLAPALVGKEVAVVATYSNPAYVSAKATSDVVEVGKGSLPAVSVKVVGTAVVDGTLTATATKVDSATVAYAWSADGKAISGATASKLKLTPSLVGKKVSVVATYTHPAYVTAKATSSAVTVVAAKLANPKVTVSGILRVTRTLSAKATWATKPEKVTYQWYADSKAIKGATKSSLRLTPSFIGKKITVTVTGTRAGYTTAKTTSSRTASVPKIDSKLSVSVPTGTKKITGTVSIKVKVNPTGAESVKGAVVLKIGKAKVKTTVTKAGTFTVKVPASKIGVATNPTMRVSYTPDSKTSKHTSKGHVVVKSSLKVRR